MYGAANLWEHIDGAAEQYLAYEFQDLATAAYTRAAGGTATVEIYRMLDAVHAYGIYAQELSPTAARVAIGVEGRAGQNSLKFWSNDFYVKVASPRRAAPSPQADVLELAKAVAAGLGAPGKPPAQLAWFTRSSRPAWSPTRSSSSRPTRWARACSPTPSKRNTPARPSRRRS